MIKWNHQIWIEHQDWKIKIIPFDSSHITANSYDLRLWNKFIIYTDDIIDSKQKPNYKEIYIGDGEYMELKRWDFVLWCTLEKIGGDHFVPTIHAKSGTARIWLSVHVTVDLIDIWSFWVSTLQLYATLPCRLYPWMSIAQVSFWKPKWENKKSLLN